MSEEIIFLIGVILMNILFWIFIHIFEIKQTKLENKMELEKQVEQLENIRKEAIKLIEEDILGEKIENVNWNYDECYYSDMPVERIKPLLNILSKGEHNGK